MNSRQHLFYAMGILAYAIARSDGKVQHEELEELRALIAEDAEYQFDLAYAEIIFRLLDKHGDGPIHTYDWALAELSKGRHHLTSSLIDRFLNLLQRVAAAYPPTTEAEQVLINRFSEEVLQLLPKQPIV